MRTTIRLKDDLLRRAKKQAAAEGRTLTSLIEEGLTVILSKPKRSRKGRVNLPVSKASGGVLPGVDLNRSSDLEEVINRAECDRVVIGTPIDLSRLVKIGKPAHRVHYALAEKGDVKLSAIVNKFLDEKIGK